MTTSAKRIPISIALLLLCGFMAMLLLDSTPPPPGVLSKEDLATECYYMIALKPGQEAPPPDAFGDSVKSNKFCYLSPLPNSSGMFLTIPLTPCNSLYRTIQFEGDGFRSVATAPQDNSTLLVTGQRRDDGVYTVTLGEGIESIRIAIRRVTDAELGPVE